jgi:hypothetical protein
MLIKLLHICKLQCSEHHLCVCVYKVQCSEHQLSVCLQSTVFWTPTICVYTKYSVLNTICMCVYKVQCSEHQLCVYTKYSVLNTICMCVYKVQCSEPQLFVCLQSTVLCTTNRLCVQGTLFWTPTVCLYTKHHHLSIYRLQYSALHYKHAYITYRNYYSVNTVTIRQCNKFRP